MRQSIAVLFIFFLGLVGCTTTKKKSDITKSKRAYHNMTAYYNGYFHANEILELSLLDISNSKQENYNQILSLSPYTNNYDPKAYAKDMDKAITKVTTVASLHDESRWVDDCYVLMGKAQFVKKDYESAEETFEYFKEEFDFSQYHVGKNKTNRKLSNKERKKQRKIQEQERAVEKKEREKVREEEAKERQQTKKEREKEKKQKMKERKKARKKKDSRSRAAEGVKWEEPQVEKKKPEQEKKAEVKEEDEEEEENKKEDEVSKQKKQRHTPAYYEGILWLAKTYSERQRFSSAEYLFNALAEDKDVPKDVKKQIPLSKARMFLVKKDFDNVLKSLDEAIEVERDRKLRSRYSYVKAQVYSRMGDAGQALKAFENVKSYRPTFEMAYNADINKIILRHEIGSITQDRAVKELNRMLKEEKYNSFEGQTYFALGQVKMKSGDREGALEDFRKSIKFNQNNQTQKIESYYTLASLFFENAEYATSKYYYDSTLQVMPKSDFRFTEVESYSKNLSRIAKNIEIIQEQDSLLALSNLSDDDLRDYAVEVLDKRGAESAPEPEVSTTRNYRTNTRLNGSNFFAFNPIAAERGKKAFINEWGTRSLSDNWRTISDTDIEESIAEGVSQNLYSDQQIASVLKNIPQNEGQKELSRRKIQEAMFELGKQYRERLKNYQAALDQHVELYNTYPKFTNKPELLYYMHLSAKDLGRGTQASKFKKELISQFPESEFAKLLSDPEYALAQLEAEKAPVRYYEKTYELFEKGKYQNVVQRANKAGEFVGDDKSLLAKMALLKAMSLGQTKGKKDYIRNLDNLIKDYPNTPEERRATEIKRFLSGDESAFDEVLYNEDKQQFVTDFDKLHYGLIVVFKASSKVLNEMRIDMSKFHKTYFSLDQLTTQTIPLDQDNKVSLILVRKFDDKQKAMDYYQTIDEKDKEFIKKKGYSFEFFVINQNNYREVVKSRSVNEYRIFFEEEYLK